MSSDLPPPPNVFAGMEYAHLAMYYSDLLVEETPTATTNVLMISPMMKATTTTTHPLVSSSSCLCEILGLVSMIIACWALVLARRRTTLTVVDAQPLSNTKETHVEV